MKFIDLAGERFGRLTVIERSPNDGRRTMWKCRCQCGSTVTVRAENLRSGNTQSCGCYEKEQTVKRLYKHGMSGTRLAGIYNAMLQRCYNINNSGYQMYGGRGISVCEEWLNDPKSFYDWCLLNGYGDGLSIDRIDNNGNYSPENCRWVDFYTQANNTRKNVYIEFKGEVHTIKEWSRITGIKYNTLYSRIVLAGWDISSAFDPKLRVNQYSK